MWRLSPYYILGQASALCGRTVFCTDRRQDCGETRGSGLCLHQWCLLLKRSQHGWRMFPRCSIFNVKTLTILSAQKIHQCVCFCCLHSPWCKLQELYEVISSHVTEQPGSIFTVVVDFYLTDLKTVLPTVKLLDFLTGALQQSRYCSSPVGGSSAPPN